MSNFHHKNVLQAEIRQYVQEKIEANAFLKHIDLRINKIERGYTEAIVPFHSFLQQQNGFVHGGVTATLCDMLAGYAAYTLVKPGQFIFTVELKVSYLNKGEGDFISGKGFVIKEGNSLHFCEAEVYAGNDEKQSLIAKASATMAVVTPG